MNPNSARVSPVVDISTHVSAAFKDQDITTGIGQLPGNCRTGDSRSNDHVVWIHKEVFVFSTLPDIVGRDSIREPKSLSIEVRDLHFQ
jgi:hypothetical protein